MIALFIIVCIYCESEFTITNSGDIVTVFPATPNNQFVRPHISDIGNDQYLLVVSHLDVEGADHRNIDAFIYDENNDLDTSFVVSTSPSYKHKVHPRSLMVSDSEYMVLWATDEITTYDYFVKGSVYNAETNDVVWDDFLIKTGTNDYYKPDLDLFDEEIVIVVIQGNRRLDISIINTQEKTVSGTVIYDSDEYSESDFFESPRIAVLPKENKFAVIGYHDDSNNVTLRLFEANIDDSEITFLDHINVFTGSTEDELFPSIALISDVENVFVCAWESNDVVYFQIFENGIKVLDDDVVISEDGITYKKNVEVQRISEYVFAIVYTQASSGTKILAKVFNVFGEELSNGAIVITSDCSSSFPCQFPYFDTFSSKKLAFSWIGIMGDGFFSRVLSYECTDCIFNYKSDGNVDDDDNDGESQQLNFGEVITFYQSVFSLIFQGVFPLFLIILVLILVNVEKEYRSVERLNEYSKSANFDDKEGIMSFFLYYFVEPIVLFLEIQRSLFKVYHGDQKRILVFLFCCLMCAIFPIPLFCYYCLGLYRGILDIYKHFIQIEKKAIGVLFLVGFGILFLIWMWISISLSPLAIVIIFCYEYCGCCTRTSFNQYGNQKTIKLDTV